MESHETAMAPHDDASIEAQLAALPSTSPAQSTPVAEIMTRDVTAVRPDASMGVLTRLLLLKGISGVPVVDASGRPLGVVSKTDVLRALGPDEHGACARDIMTPVSIAMPEHASIARAAALMVYEHVHRVVITGPSGEVTGLVTTLDVLRWLARHDGYAVP